MKTIAIALFLGFNFIMTAQDPYLQKGDKRAEALAQMILEKYDKELSMGAEQRILFENKLIEFLIRENKIKNLDMSVRDKLKTLTRLSAQETAEMRNILTRPQWRYYKKLKKRYQPVVVEVGKVNQ